MTEEKKPRDWRRVGRISTAILVGSIAAIASFDHQRDLAIRTGQSKFIGTLMPVSVDVLILFATFAMDGRNRLWPRLTFWTGVGATISANVLAAPHNLLSQLISAWAPLALLFVIETEARRNKVERWRWRKQAAADVPSKPADVTLIETSVPPAEPKPRMKNQRGLATDKKLAAAWKRNRDVTPAELAAKAGTSESTARRFINDQKSAEFDAEVAALTDEPVTVPAGAKEN